MTPQVQEDEGRGVTANRARVTGAALECHYRFILWLVPTVDRFPRSRKFSLGDRIETTALDVLERLIEATYSRRRAAHLAAANLGLEKLRFLFRLACDLRVLDRRRYEHADTWRLRQTIFRDGWFDPSRGPDPPPDAFCAAVPGTTNRGTSSPRTATGTPPATATTTVSE